MRNIDIKFILKEGIKAAEIFGIPETTVQNASDPISKARSFGLHLTSPFHILSVGEGLRSHRTSSPFGPLSGTKRAETIHYDYDNKTGLCTIPLGIKLWLPKYMTLLFVPLFSGGISYMVDKTVKEPFRVVLYCNHSTISIDQGELIMKVIPIVEEPYAFSYNLMIEDYNG